MICLCSISSTPLTLIDVACLTTCMLLTAAFAKPSRAPPHATHVQAPPPPLPLISSWPHAPFLTTPSLAASVSHGLTQCNTWNMCPNAGKCALLLIWAQANPRLTWSHGNNWVCKRSWGSREELMVMCWNLRWCFHYSPWSSEILHVLPL